MHMCALPLTPVRENIIFRWVLCPQLVYFANSTIFVLAGVLMLDQILQNLLCIENLVRVNTHPTGCNAGFNAHRNRSSRMPSTGV